MLYIRWNQTVLWLVLHVVSTQPLRAQAPVDTSQQAVGDKAPLPFYIHPSKRLPEFEIEEKKQGSFVTGLPRIEFDPIRGFGAGGNLFLLINKTPDDPFYEYTPYRHRVSTEFFIFENGRVRYSINYDAPYIFNSKWRLRSDAVLWEDPEAQYWGVGQQMGQRLQLTNPQTGQVETFRRLKDYEHALATATQSDGGLWEVRTNRHNFIQREQLYNVLLERVMLGGKLRFMFGYEALFTAFTAYGGKLAEEAFDESGNAVTAFNQTTLIEEQNADGTWERFNLAGFKEDYQFTSMLAGALIYDTRDFEPDPSRGVFLEYSQEYTAPWLGSNFNFNKLMVQGQWFHTLHQWNKGRGRLTFAGLAAFGYIFGPNINFIEMWDLSSQAEAGGILVLGGERSVRGFREARFLAPTVGLVNLELRSRLYDFHLLKQHFSLGLNVFYDTGAVWDTPGDASFANWVGAPGLGARISWNRSTIIRYDLGISREGTQSFLGFGHIF